jgi:3-phosphoshikimate 1-carboxyvinyltransferase
MSFLKVNKGNDFNLIIGDIASDKSISHRCAIFSLLSDKSSHIVNFLQAEDTLNTLNIIQNLGAKVSINRNITTITPPKKINEPMNVLDCGNSGTAMRLMCGFLSSKDGFFVLQGDKYLSSRPMNRVSNPLRKIGAKIDGRDDANLSPICIRGGILNGFKYESKIASAQVKSAMILSALNAKEKSYYHEPSLSRDHTERILFGMGAKIKKIEEKGVKNKNWIEIHSLQKPLKPLDMEVPADPSSAFFFAVATVISKNSKIILKNVLLNPTRIEAFEILKKMGADIEYVVKDSKYEVVGDIIVKSSSLKGVNVKDNIAWLIDELPALSIAMSVAKGVSKVINAKELRVKESDRIKSIVINLQACGVDIKEFEDGYEINGSKIKKANINSFGDHRIAMSFAIAGVLNGMNIKDIDCIKTSFPNFLELLGKITRIEVGD